MRRFCAMLLCIYSILCLSGCLALKTDIQLESDGSGKLDFYALVDKEFIETSGGTAEEFFGSNPVETVQINGTTYLAFKTSFTANSAIEMESKLKSIRLSDIVPVVHEGRDDSALRVNLFKSAKLVVRNMIGSNSISLDLQTAPLDLTGGADMGSTQPGDLLKYYVRVRMPYNIKSIALSSNPISSNNGNSATKIYDWVIENTTISNSLGIVAEKNYLIPLVVISAIVVLLAGIVVTLVIWVRRKSVEDG